MIKPRVVITGSSGLVGSRITELLEANFEFIPLRAEACDITKKDSVWNALKTINYDFFIHLAAYTNVDGAEKNRNSAHEINVVGTQNVFDVNQEKKGRFLYISTDFVFDGKQSEYIESSKPNPVGYYGQTKWEGEKIVGDKGTIIRIAYPYRKTYELKKDFVRTIKSLLQEGKELKMVQDATITPTFIDDIALGLQELILQYTSQIVHLVGANSMSPYNAGLTIAKTFGFDEKMIRATTFNEYYAGKAIRPQYSTMKTDRKSSYPMKTFEAGLQMLV